jgi:hypothetical protein
MQPLRMHLYTVHTKETYLIFCNNYLFNYTTRNHRLLVFLFSKSKKGTKNAFAPYFNVRPVNVPDG